MLNTGKLKKLCQQRRMTAGELAGRITRAGLSQQQAATAIGNWKKGLLKPIPRREDVRRLAEALSVDENDLVAWRSSCRYAPISARKARLVTQLIAGRRVREVMDILKFTEKRAAAMVDKVLRSAVADADEQQADVDNLYVAQARVDDAGTRLGTKTWIPKDRGKAYPISQRACHIHITVAEP